MGRGLTGNQLKYIAVTAMVLDHVGMVFLSINTIPGLLCRIVGRLTAPIMCFLLSEGYAYTSNRRRYGIRLLIFGLLSQIPYALINYGIPTQDPLTGQMNRPTFWEAVLHPDFNMILTLFLCFLALYVYDLVPGFQLRCVLFGAIFAAAMFCDWGLAAPVYTLAFAIFRESRAEQAKWFSFITIGYVAIQTMFCISSDQNWYGQMWQLGLFLFLPFLFLYNGARGSKAKFHKWFFYLFYPLHLVGFWLLKLYVV